MAAGPVYRLLGGQGLGADGMPSLNRPIMYTIGFHIRPGRHAVTPYEGDQYLEFADGDPRANLRARHPRMATKEKPPASPG